MLKGQENRLCCARGPSAPQRRVHRHQKATCSPSSGGSPLRRRERSNRCLAGAVGPMNGFQTPDGKRSKAGEPGSTARDGLEWEFLVGTAISVYQNSGGDNNNWWRYERQRTRFGKPTIDRGQKCEQSNNFWENYEEDIARVASLRSTVFRLSLEWHRIEPEQGKIDQDAVAHYHKIFDCIRKKGLKIALTLHHFVQPLWFEDMGGFTKGDNIRHFTSFACVAFREFHESIDLWITFNEPNVMAFCGWLYGQFPPGLLANFKLAGSHLLNMFRAHAAAYKAIKELPGGKASRIGIVHNIMAYETLAPHAFSARWVDPVVTWLNRVWATETTIEYFRDGHFSWMSPWASTMEAKDERPGLDFVGMNYYGKVSIDWKYSSAAVPPGVMTDMPFQLDAPGIYKGLRQMSALDVPMYITETGIADAAGDRRPLWLETYVPEVERAVRDGLDVRGLMYWTLVDNFEWAHGFDIKFGLYRWDPGMGSKREMRAATPLLAGIYKELPDQMKRAHKRAMEDRAYALKSKGDIQVFPSPQSVLETTSFSGSDDHV